MENGKQEQPDYVILRSRRRSLRKQLLVLKIRGEDNKGVFFGYAKTLSTGGMFISSVNPRKLGEEFEITFKFPEGPAEIKCKCVVVWQREYDPKGKYEPGMGIKFVDLTPEVAEKIIEIVKKS